MQHDESQLSSYQITRSLRTLEGIQIQLTEGVLMPHHSSSSCAVIGACRAAVLILELNFQHCKTAPTTYANRLRTTLVLRIAATIRCCKHHNALHSKCLFPKVTHILELCPECEKPLLSDLVVAVTLCVHKVDCRVKTTAQHQQSVADAVQAVSQKCNLKFVQETHS
jgi:hypothetical protein